MAARRPPPQTPTDAVDRILGDPTVLWLPIRHFSPASAWQVARAIRDTKPAAVLVEGPEDATPLIPHLIHPDTRPPVTLMSSWTDRRNAFGGNGVLSPDPSVPARYRGWWPMVAWSPEYQALRAGHEVGADLSFIDTSLRASVPWTFVPRARNVVSVSDRHRLEEAFFAGLVDRSGARSFEDFWRSQFELGAIGGDAERWFRAVLTFAWCARNVETRPEALEADGTLPRERHMAWHIRRARRAHPDRRIAVVTGAFHTVGLPWIKPRKALKADAATSTLLTAHSWRALARLYDRARFPGWGGAVWAAIQAGQSRPHDAACREILVQVMRTARARDLPASTADAVAATTQAQNLARLRRRPEPGLEEVLDAVQSTFVKGALHTHGAVIEHVHREVLIGHRIGQVAEAAGRPALLQSFYQTAKRLKLDLSGASKTVRCDPAKQARHKDKSAFLHQCDLLEIPLFEALPGRRFDAEPTHYRGANWTTGEDLQLVAETWAIRWCEAVDDRLLELSDRGPTLAAVAQSLVTESLLGVCDDVAAAVRLLLRIVQMRLDTGVDEALQVMETAVIRDHSFANLCQALADLVVLHGLRDGLDAQGDRRVALAALDVYRRACVRLPTICDTGPDQTPQAIDALTTLVRVAATFRVPDDAWLDRGLLVDRLQELVEDPEGNAAIRGAAFGVLFGLGAVRERRIAAELESYLLGSPRYIQQGAAFMEGLFGTARSIVLGRDPRLLRVVHRALSQLDWDSFKLLLPDLRRAFTGFIPAELEAIAERVSSELGPQDASEDPPVTDALVRLIGAADARVSAALP